MKKLFGKGKGDKKDKAPPSSEAAANAAAEELKQFTTPPPSFGGWGAPSSPPAAPSQSEAPPPYTPPPPQPQAPLGYTPPPQPQAPLGYTPPPPTSFAPSAPADDAGVPVPPAGAPPFAGGGPGGFGGAPFGGPEPLRQTPGTEEEAVTEMALMDYAKRTGKRPEDSVVRVDPVQAESMRDRALREYLERQRKVQREREAMDLTAKAEAARARFAQRREPELPEFPEEPEIDPELGAAPAADFERFASRFGIAGSLPGGDSDGKSKRTTRPKAKAGARKATVKKSPGAQRAPAPGASTRKPAGKNPSRATAQKKVAPAKPAAKRATSPKAAPKKPPAVKPAPRKASVAKKTRR